MLSEGAHWGWSVTALIKAAHLLTCPEWTCGNFVSLAYSLSLSRAQNPATEVEEGASTRQHEPAEVPLKGDATAATCRPAPIDRYQDFPSDFNFSQNSSDTYRRHGIGLAGCLRRRQRD